MVLNFNSKSGLPSNLVYTVIKDKNGYLWCSTPKGVVRYNGYEFKLFNLSDGLPTEDVWELYEDKKGRIWLGNISEEYGYIYNGKYHKAILKDFAKNTSTTLYPQQVRDWDKGIIFCTPYISGSKQPMLCIEQNDTICQYEMPNEVFPGIERDFTQSNTRQVYIFTAADGTPYFFYKHGVYKVVVENNKASIKKTLNMSDSAFSPMLVSSHGFITGDYVVSKYPTIKASLFMTLNLKNGTVATIDATKYAPGDTAISHLFRRKNCNEDNTFYVVTRKYLLQFEDKNGIQFTKATLLPEYLNNTPLDGNSIGILYPDNFWGKAITTNKNGLFLEYSIENHFKKESIDLAGYKYLGGINDKVTFWENYGSRSLLKIENGMQAITTKNIPNIPDISTMVQYNRDTFLAGGLYLYLYNPDKNTFQQTSKVTTTLSFGAVIVDPSRMLYMVSPANFCKMTLTNPYDHINQLDYDRYKGLTYDSVHQNYWAYTHDKVLIYNNATGTKSNVTPATLGIKKIEKLIIDNTYSNVFCKSYNNVTVYNNETKTFKDVFPKYNLQESSMHLYNNTLIVVGHFGILFCKVLGKQQLSDPILYPNVKDVNYENVYDVQTSWGKVLLNTDKGVYTVAIPSDIAMIAGQQDNLLNRYQFVLNYKNSTTNLRTGDTVIVSQNDLKFQFDVINPMGNGKLKYTYRLLNNTAKELNANELTLPQLQPDNYYNLYIASSDNVWKSGDIKLVIYITPHWWQTRNMRIVIWTLVVLLIVFLFAAAILITRRVVLGNAKKRNMRMEMELKAIYAQINPHFIFNSLNSAMLLVSKNKMDDAYLHISKFSRLLRSYIKSSRNKYISVEEEIVNLRNYIELQQVRFKNKFSYDIIVAEPIFEKGMKIPSLLLQPFVENAIEHGLLSNEKKGNLIIEFTMPDNDVLVCTIDDDGVGREESKKISKLNTGKEESYGNLLVKDLVKIFSKYENVDVDIKYEDKPAPLSGTIVTIKIKYQNNGLK